MTVNHGVGIS